MDTYIAGIKIKKRVRLVVALGGQNDIPDQDAREKRAGKTELV